MSDLDRWLAAKRLSTQCVLTNRWDRQDLLGMARETRSFVRARKRLSGAVDTGAEALNDLFWMLLKANPALLPGAEIAPSHLLNRTVAAEAMGLAALRRLRRASVGDSLQAALACVKLEPALRAIFDRLAVEQALVVELVALVEVVKVQVEEVSEAETALDALLDSDDPPEDLAGTHAATDRLRAAKEALDGFQGQAEDIETELRSRLEDVSAVANVTLRSAMTEAADVAERNLETERVWGVEPGHLRRLPAAERLALAAKLNTEWMAEVADLFGRMEGLAFSTAPDEVDDRFEQVRDVEVGDSLGRLLPAELLLLGVPEAEAAFLARYAGRELLQYEASGEDELGRGGIVFCCDSSGTMQGEREQWSKAVMLVLLHRARHQGRSMDVIHFGSPGQFEHFGFPRPEDFTPARIIEATEFFLAGGTDFKTPMEVALGLLVAEFNATGKTKQDVVFVTDDECSVPDEFMAHYLAEMRRLGARTFGVYVAGTVSPTSGPLFEMSEGRVMSVQDLQSGNDIRALLAAR